jgi:hypothetical protein
MTAGFERLNFFKGLFLQAEDWQREQEYHKEKHRYHNKYLHTPGVAFGCLEDLEVTANREGTTLIVASGYAIDGEGHDLYLAKAHEIKLPALQSFHPPTTIYVSLRFNEKAIDMRVNEANPQYSGNAFISEGIVLEITPAQPDNHMRIELARIELSESPEQIKKAVDESKPGPDEIDLRYVKGAGARAAARQKELTLADLGVKVMDTSIQVRTSTRKQEDTYVLIEKINNKETPPPMYMVHVQSMDSTRIQWWIECGQDQENGTSEYTLHIKNYSNLTTTVMCRVFRMRI